MSALPPKADIRRTAWNVRFVPTARQFGYRSSRGHTYRSNAEYVKLGRRTCFVMRGNIGGTI